MIAPFAAPRIVRATSLAAASELVAQLGSDGRIVSGATALQLEWRRGAEPPSHLVDVTGLPELSGIAETATGTIRIGAATRLAVLERDRCIAERLPLLAETVRRVAAPGVRQLATIGGNIATGSGCLLPTLLALAAELEVLEAGTLSVRALRDWLGEPAPRNGIIVAVVISPATSRQHATHRKIGLRAAFTPSVIGAAGVIVLDQAGHIDLARFAVGGGSTPPQCLDRAAAGIAGLPLEAVDWRNLRNQLAAEIDAPSDHFRSSRYRKIAAANALAAGLGGRKAVAAICGALSACPRIVPQIHKRPPEIEVSRRAQGERWRIRPDIADKVAGRLAYLTDHRARDMLVARILRAGIAHARIVAIDVSAAEALPGVVAVVTAADIKGQNGYGIVVQDQPALCADKVRYVGDPVAAVAAVDAETAARALALIRVDYEPLPIVGDMAQALAPTAPKVHASGNLQRELGFSRGDIETAWSRCTHIVEDTYVTPRQMHGFMETEGGYVVPQPDGTLLVAVGGQHGARDRMQLARILDIPEHRIRVVTSPTGGAFGGKDELTVQPALALLALKSGARSACSSIAPSP